MDSQGFVPLELITNFKRIKQLTSDVDMIKVVCQSLPQVEFQSGDDGVDRLRKRDKWEQWVVPMEQRDPAARNEGPPPPNHNRRESHVHEQPQHPHIYPMMQSYDPPTAAQWTNGSGREDVPNSGPSPYSSVNSTEEHHITQTPLSSEAPAFAPQTYPYPTNGPTGVSYGPNENEFSDGQIQELKIVVRRPGLSPGPSSPPVKSATSRTFSHGSMNGDAMLGHQANGQPVLGLRGGAAAPEM